MRKIMRLGSFTLVAMLALGWAVAPAAAAEGELVSKTSTGVPANGDSRAIAVSSNGRFVLFTSNANNLPGPNIDDPEYWLMYRRDLVTGETILVSIGPDGGRPLAVASINGDMSADGSVVAFVSHDSTRLGANVYVRNLGTGVTTLESKRTSGARLRGGSPQLSRNARRLAFLATSTLGEGDVYGRDLVSGKTRLLLCDENGQPGAASWVGAPTISGNGRYIAFEVESDIQPPGCGAGEPHIYDWRTNTFRCFGGWGEDGPEAVALSYTGRYLAWHEYTLRASDLVTGETVELPLDTSDQDDAVSWSDDERYLAFSAFIAFGETFGYVVHRFDRITETFDAVTSPDGFCTPALRALTGSGGQVLVTCFDELVGSRAAYLVAMPV